MTTLEQVQEFCDDHYGPLSLCDTCEESAATKHVFITIGGKRFCDGPFCAHKAENIRAGVAEIPGVADVQIAELAK